MKIMLNFKESPDYFKIDRTIDSITNSKKRYSIYSGATRIKCKIKKEDNNVPIITVQITE
jgi:hypothetical protein